MTTIFAAEDELHKVSEVLMQLAENDKVFVFRGDLGAGKTTLIKNICNFLNVKDEVNSPTFSIVNEYETQEGERLYHFDFYRIEEEEEALDMGVEDYFYSNNICLVEWPSKIEQLLPEQRIEVEIKAGEVKREFTINQMR